MEKKALTTWILPLIIIIAFTFILFRPYILHGLVPVPGDILLGHYYPWKDQVWQGRVAGYPIKNFILFDGIRQTLPWRLLAVEQMKAGKWPLWNPYILLGMPLLGNWQVAAFYPFNILFFFLPFLDAWSIYILLQPILAGLFVYFFLRTIGGSKGAGLLAGICYGFSLIMMNHLEFGIDGHTALWLPLSLGAINKINSTKKWRWGGILTVAVLMSLLGGYPPPAIYNLIIIFFYFLFKTRSVFSLKGAIVVVSLILALLLASPQLLPAYELSRRVVRQESQFGVASGESYFFPWENLIMTIAPDFFGHPATGNFFSRIYYTDNPSVGLVGFLFVLYAIFFSLTKREARFWLFWIVFPLLLMLETPLGKGLRLIRIPFLSLVTPMRMIWIITLSLAFLAGLGFDAFLVKLKELRSTGRNLFSFLLPIITGWEILFTVWAASFFIPLGLNVAVAQKNLILPTVFLTFSTALIIIIIFFPRLTKLLLAALILLSGVELVRQGVKYNPFIEKQLVFPSLEIFKSLDTSSSFYRAIITHPELIPVNSNIPYHLQMLDGYASLGDSRTGQLIKLASASYPVKQIDGYPRVVFQTEFRSSLIDLLGGKHIFSLEEIKNPKLKLIGRIGKTSLYENLKVLPKVFCVGKYFVEKEDLAIANRMLRMDVGQEVVVEKEPSVPISPCHNATARILEYQDGRIKMESFSDKSVLLVVTDSFYPGWQALVDGQKSEILRADYNLRAVVVSNGHHQILMAYKPKSFLTGLTIFGFTFGGLTLLVLLRFLLKLPLFKR